MAREGDMAAFEEIVKRYEGKIARTVLGMVPEADEAEDIGQETFIRFYRSLHTFRGDSALGTYLTRIAINLSPPRRESRLRKAPATRPGLPA